MQSFNTNIPIPRSRKPYRRLNIGIKAGTKEYHAAYYLKDQQRFKQYNRLREYGLTNEQYTLMLTEQNNSCKSCGSQFGATKTTESHIDHDHKTGKVRGLLCGGCNLALGHLNENAERCDSLGNYIREFT